MARVLASRATHCPCCGSKVADNTTDFGNGLQLRLTERGVEFRVVQAFGGQWPGPQVDAGDFAGGARGVLGRGVVRVSVLVVMLRRRHSRLTRAGRSAIGFPSSAAPR